MKIYPFILVLIVLAAAGATPAAAADAVPTGEAAGKAKLGQAAELASTNRAEADTLTLGVLDDPSCGPAVRAAAAIQYAKRLRSDRFGNMNPAVATLKKALAIRELAANDIVRLQEEIVAAVEKDDSTLRSGDKLAANTLPDAVHAILALPGAPAKSKVKASGALAESLLLQGKASEAEAIARAPLKDAQLDANDKAAALINVGRLLEWQNKPDEAIAVYQSFGDNPPEALSRAIVACLVFHRRYEEADRACRAANLPVERAKLYQATGDTAQHDRLMIALLENEKETPANRVAAYQELLTADPALYKFIDQYFDFYVTNNVKRAGLAFFSAAQREPMWQANYAYADRCFTFARKAGGQETNHWLDVYHAHALAGLGRFSDAAKIAEEGTLKEAYTPAQRYRLALIAAVMQAPDQAEAVEKAVADANRNFGNLKSLAPKEISGGLINAAKAALIAKRETAARELYRLNQALYVPEPKKTYTLDFHGVPVTGISDWDRMKNPPSIQKFDRQYGGNLEFLVTDVATGDRGSGIGSEQKKAKRFTEFSALCDVNGIHFLFKAYDDKVKEVQSGLLGAGSYEAYLAPGFNQPYFCFLSRHQTGITTLWQSSYNTAQYLRPDPDNREHYRYEHVFTDDGYRTYVFFAWELFPDTLPDDGDYYEFENIHWGRGGGYSWNGTKSIHGRSSWGKLLFKLSAADRAAIKRRLLYKALAKYKAEKLTSGAKDGVLSFWQDDAVGDPEFYTRRVKPLVDKLDACAARVKAELSDAEVNELYREAAHGWNKLPFIVADMRRQYLEDKLGE